MAVWNEKYYKGTDVYSDGDIEDKILQIVSDRNYSEWNDETVGSDYTIAYHLSSIRENILNWYPFSKEESAIEIGAGCGAITGVLCRKLGEVVSVDLSKRRSKINYERHKNYENLEIIIGNFNDIVLEKQYDYVILNGVFEYAISFTESDSPYNDFLRHISRFLKPNGKFLIAIENRLGLKYFNGAKEDHTGNYFLGLNNYVGNQSVRTFSKKEITELLEEEGYKYSRFYYPYPDYKFPNEIFTDETINMNQYGRPYINIEDDRYWLFDEYEVGKTLIKEDIRNIFANSFLVEASKEAFEKKVLYAKLNVERKPEFQIGTSIIQDKENRLVEKYAIHPNAKKHIEQVYQNTSNNIGKVEYLPAQKENERIKFEYLYSDNLDTRINELVEKRDVTEICYIMDNFFQTFIDTFNKKKTTCEFYSDRFHAFFGEKESKKEFLCVKNANIDVIMDNIYYENDRYLLIDGEWVYPDWIPFLFIVWRSLNELYAKHVDLDSIFKRKDMMERYGISEEDEQLFHSWAVHFAENYVGGSQRKKIAKSITNISIDDIHRDFVSKRIANMSLYMDFGEGFSEEAKVYCDVDIQNGKFDVTFESDKLPKAKRLRFDPIEGKACLIEITDLQDGVYEEENNSDGIYQEQPIYTNLDPQIFLRGDLKTTNLRIHGKIRVLNMDEVLGWNKDVINNHKMIDEHLKIVEDRVKELFDEGEKLKDTLRESKKQYQEKLQMVEEQREFWAGKSRESEQYCEELSRKIDEVEAQRNYWAEQNEINSLYANSTKAFIKRKMKIKINSMDERLRKNKKGEQFEK